MILDLISWAFIAALPFNLYILWHGWTLNRSVEPRSPFLRAMLWAKFSIFFLNVYLTVVGYRYLNNVEPVLPFGGIGLGFIFLFILTVPAAIHSQMRRFISDEHERSEVRDAARDVGRDEVRDPARDLARDAEHDIGK